MTAIKEADTYIRECMAQVRMPFVAGANGYQIIAYPEDSERSVQRRETLAPEVAEDKWLSTHGPDATRYERRDVTTINGRRYIGVQFSEHRL